MYCKKCGKFIGTDVDICDECKQNEVPLNVNTAYQTANPYENEAFYQLPTIVQQDTSVINLGKAIAATILATIGFIFVYAGILSILEPPVAIVCMVLGLVPAILGLIFGCQSISNFKQTAYIRSGKRIPVLILGISSVANSGNALLWSLILLLLA